MSSKQISNNVLDALDHCFASSEYSDLTISCGTSTWKVHRIIVCSQSPVLRAACEGFFMEAACKVINLEDDPLAVNLMLTFLYKGDYDHSSLEQQPNLTPLTLHAKIYILADKYQILTLMRLAEEKYKEVLASNSDLEDYFLSIPEVYILPPTSTGQLRPIAVQYARQILRECITKENVREHLQRLIIEVPEFGFEVLEVFVNSTVRGRCITCESDQDAEVLQARCRNCGKGGLRDMFY